MQLSNAALAGDYAAVESLLRRGAHPNAYVGSVVGPSPPLHAAAAGGHASVVHLLLAWGADPATDTPGYGTPLHRAAEAGDLSTVVLLLDHGAPVNARECDTDCTPLCYALAAGRGPVANVLIEHGAVTPASCFCRGAAPRSNAGTGVAESSAESGRTEQADERR
jgi:ankyrin repeat protein